MGKRNKKMNPGRKKKKKPAPLRRLSKGTVTSLIVIVCITAIVGYDFYSRSKRESDLRINSARVKGNPNAALKILNFSDFQCSHCAQGTKVLDGYFAKYHDEIFLEMKYFPLGQKNSMISSRFAECAARQGNFWDFHDQLFLRQSQWRSLMDPKHIFKKIAEKVSLDFNALETCSAQESVKGVIMADKAAGQSKHIKSTPTYFVNGDMVVGPKSIRLKLKKYFGR